MTPRELHKVCVHYGAVSSYTAKFTQQYAHGLKERTRMTLITNSEIHIYHSWSDFYKYFTKFWPIMANIRICQNSPLISISCLLEENLTKCPPILFRILNLHKIMKISRNHTSKSLERKKITFWWYNYVVKNNCTAICIV